MQAQGFTVSSLHTGSAAPLYEKLGWKSVVRFLVCKPKAVFSLESVVVPSGTRIRKPDFTSDSEVLTLAQLYARNASRFNGTFVRDDPQYWKLWIAQEAQHAYILETAPEKGSPQVRGYLSLKLKQRSRGKLAIVQDFFVDDAAIQSDLGKGIFDVLLIHALQRVEVEYDYVVYPAPIFRENVPEEYLWKEPGTMYLPLRDLQDKNIEELLHGTSSPDTTTSLHVFWDADGF